MVGVLIRRHPERSPVVPSLPQIATALEQVLTTVADDAAVAVGFTRRQRVLTGATFVQALVLGWLGQPQATLHQLTQALAVRGVPISPQGLAQRFGPAAAALLAQVLAAAVRVGVTAAGVEAPLLTRFAGGVWVLDCTTIALPDALAAIWPGCGGRTTQGTQAALKLQVRLDLAGGWRGRSCWRGARRTRRGHCIPPRCRPTPCCWPISATGAWTGCGKWRRTARFG
jgi:hypothetical protein